ncbi:MAG: hypothetical protein HY647_02725, partial [Acidobacteria bacterium]|nr:hypothetical protein [Acidobacteriota bacterium]
RQRRAARIVLEVSVHNPDAIQFYEMLGYTVRHQLPRYYRDGTDAYRMEKVCD